MEHMFPIFIHSTLLTAGLTLGVVWSRKETAVRHWAVAMLLISVPLLALNASDTLGWHKPLWAAWRLDGEQRVLAHKLVEEEAIYLYLDVGEGEPRAIKLPWNQEIAEKLQEAARRGGSDMKFEWSWDLNPPQFHDLPQPKLPSTKEPQREPAQRYQRGA